MPQTVGGHRGCPAGGPAAGGGQDGDRPPGETGAGQEAGVGHAVRPFILSHIHSYFYLYFSSHT